MSEISSGTYRGSRWEVDSKGAYLTSLDLDNQPLIFSRTVIAGKVRGGVFPAIPQLGPDHRPRLQAQPQHGYARETTWRPGKRRWAAASFSHVQERGEYSGLASSVTYRFNRAAHSSTSLFAKLALHNDSAKPMRVAPAFHPYFDLSRLPETDLKSMQKGLDKALTVPATQATIQVSPDTEAHIKTKGFERLTWWTDGLGPYVCVEPSLAGPSFMNGPSSEAEIMEPGDTREFEFTVAWQSIKRNNFVLNQPSLKD